VMYEADLCQRPSACGCVLVVLMSWKCCSGLPFTASYIGHMFAAHLWVQLLRIFWLRDVCCSSTST